MSKTPRYKMVLDSTDTHRGYAVQNGAGRTYGSSTPYVAAVLLLATYTDDNGNAVKRWAVERTSFTRLAAQTHADQLRGEGKTVTVVEMVLA